jgi:hypothetical protein
VDDLANPPFVHRRMWYLTDYEVDNLSRIGSTRTATIEH